MNGTFTYLEFRLFYTAACEKYHDPQPETSGNFAVLKCGNPHSGHYLEADRFGWRLALDGVAVRRELHVAAPFTNWQAALAAIGPARV